MSMLNELFPQKSAPERLLKIEIEPVSRVPLTTDRGVWNMDIVLGKPAKEAWINTTQPFANLGGQNYETIATSVTSPIHPKAEQAIDGIFGGLAEREAAIAAAPATGGGISVETARNSVNKSFSASTPTSSTALTALESAGFLRGNDTVPGAIANWTDAIAGPTPNPGVPTLPVPDSLLGLATFEEQEWAAQKVQDSYDSAGVRGVQHV